MEFKQGIADIFDIFRLDDPGGVADHLTKGTAVGTDDGTAAGHGFEGGETETFVEGRINESFGGGVESGKVVLGDEAESADVTAVGGFGDACVDEIGSMPIAATESEEPIGTGFFFETFEGFDEAAVVLSGMFEAGDIEEKWFVEAEFLEDIGAGLFGGARIEAIVIDAVVDDAKVVAMDAEKLLDIAGGVLADGNDFILAAREVLDDNAAVEHAGEVVFAGNAEGGEVVNGGDEWAGFAPGEAAVAGDVEEIETEVANQAGQDGLVPADVVDGRAKFFRDRNDFEAVIEVAEEGAILLEHEERETFGSCFSGEGAKQREYVLSDAGLATLDNRR